MLIHQGTQEINLERLTLRQFQHSDNQDMLNNWISNPDIQSMLSEPVYTTYEEVKDLLNKWIESYSKQDYYRWAVVEKASQKCIGQVAIFLVDNKNHFGEIEYCVGSEFQRRGYITEAVNGILNYSFEKINFHKIQVCHKEKNEASQRVIKKCKFTYEGTLRDFFYMNNNYVSRLYYSMLKEEWLSLQNI